MKQSVFEAKFRSNFKEMFGSNPIEDEDRKVDIKKNGKIVGDAAIVGIGTVYYFVRLKIYGKRAVTVEFPHPDRRRIGPIDMLATQSFHTLYNVGMSDGSFYPFYNVVTNVPCNKPDYACIEAEDDDNYYGSWIERSGHVNVRFPKATTRIMTPEEVLVFLRMPRVLIHPYEPPCIVHGYNERLEPIVKL